MSSEDPSRTVMRGSALSTFKVWLKHWMAVGSRIMFITNCHRMKSRAYAQCKHTHTRRSQATEVWLKHWMAVGSRIMFITNCHRMKSRAYAQCKHTHTRVGHRQQRCG